MKQSVVALPVSQLIAFSAFCHALDITIALSWSRESLLGEITVYAVVYIEKTGISAEMKEEKLREKFGRFLVNPDKL